MMFHLLRVPILGLRFLTIRLFSINILHFRGNGLLTSVHTYEFKNTADGVQ